MSWPFHCFNEDWERYQQCRICRITSCKWRQASWAYESAADSPYQTLNKMICRNLIGLMMMMMMMIEIHSCNFLLIPRQGMTVLIDGWAFNVLMFLHFGIARYDGIYSEWFRMTTAMFWVWKTWPSAVSGILQKQLLAFGTSSVGIEPGEPCWAIQNGVGKSR